MEACEGRGSLIIIIMSKPRQLTGEGDVSGLMTAAGERPINTNRRRWKRSAAPEPRGKHNVFLFFTRIMFKLLLFKDEHNHSVCL